MSEAEPDATAIGMVPSPEMLARMERLLQAKVFDILNERRIDRNNVARALTQGGASALVSAYMLGYQSALKDRDQD